MSDVNTRDEAEVEGPRGEQKQRAGGFRPVKPSCKKHDHASDHHSARGAHEHQPARGISLEINRTQLAIEEEDCVNLKLILMIECRPIQGRSTDLSS